MMSSPPSPTPTPISPHTPPPDSDSHSSSGVRIKRPRITDEKENELNQEEKELLQRVKEVQESYSVSTTSIHRALSLHPSTLSSFTSFLQGHTTDISWCNDIMMRLSKWLNDVENDDDEEEEEEKEEEAIAGIIIETSQEISNEDITETETKTTSSIPTPKTISPALTPTTITKSSSPQLSHTSTSPINLTLRSRLITLRAQHTLPLPGICLSISTSHIPPSRDVLIQETAGLQAWLEWKEGDPWTRDEAWTRDMESRLETWMNAYESKHREHDTSTTTPPLPSTSTPPPPSLSIPPLPTFTSVELTERQSTWEHQLHLMSQYMDIPLRDMINAYLTQQHYDTSNVVREVLSDVDMNELVRHRMNFIAWLTFPNLTYQHSFTSSWITAWQPLIRYWLQQQMSHVDEDVDDDVGNGIVLEDDEMDEEPVVEESTTTTTTTSSTTKKKTTTPKQATTKLHASTLAIFDTKLHTSLHTYLKSLHPSIDFATSTYAMASTLSPTYCSNFTLDKHSYYSKNYLRWNYHQMIKPQFSIEWARVAQPLMRIWLSKQLKERKRQRENGDEKDEQPLLPSKKHHDDTPKSHNAINTKRTIKSISHEMNDDIKIYDDQKIKDEMSHVPIQTLRSYVTSYLHNNHMGINTLITKIFGHSQYSSKFPNWLRGSIEDAEIVAGVESWYLSKRHRSPPSTTTTLGTKSIQTPPTTTRSNIPSTSTSTSTPTSTTTSSTPITSSPTPSPSPAPCSGCITLRPEVTRLRNETDRLISAMIVMQKQIMALQNEKGTTSSSSS